MFVVTRETLKRSNKKLNKHNR